MKYGTITWILFSVILIQVATAEQISMKTNDIYTVQFEVGNIDDGDTLEDCIPYFSGDLANQPWVLITPSNFDLSSGQERIIQISFQEPVEGYYQDQFNIRCVRYLNGELISAGDIINPSTAPKYDVVVSLAGLGQAYSINPGKEFVFISKPLRTETAQFQIANIGSAELDVKFEIPPEYATQITFDPIRSTIAPGEIAKYQVTVETSADFESMSVEVPLLIGDFGDTFTVTGSTESLATGGSAIQSVIFGDVAVQNIKIPGWLIITVLTISMYLVVKDYRGKK